MSGPYSVVRDFLNSDGIVTPSCMLISSGVIYGTSFGGGSSQGRIWKMNVDGSGLTILHSFNADSSEGQWPMNRSGTGSFQAGKLVLAAGVLYGETYYGGSGGNGTIWKINTDGTGFSIVHHFATGASALYGAPTGGLCLASNGCLYATLNNGFSPNTQALLKINTDGTGGSILIAWSNLSDPTSPTPVVEGPDNKLYFCMVGPTPTFDGNVVCRINLDGTGFTQLFNGAADCSDAGGEVLDPPIFGSDGKIYGVSMLGGAALCSDGNGVTWRVDPDGGNFEQLHDFGDDTIEANLVSPAGALLEASDGYLYGVLDGENTGGKGGVYRHLPDGSDFSIRYDCAAGGDANGYGPIGALYEDGGIIYGIMSFGGADDNGLVFKLADSPVEGVLALTLENATLDAKGGPLTIEILSPLENDVRLATPTRIHVRLTGGNGRRTASLNVHADY